MNTMVLAISCKPTFVMNGIHISEALTNDIA